MAPPWLGVAELTAPLDWFLKHSASWHFEPSPNAMAGQRLKEGQPRLALHFFDQLPPGGSSRPSFAATNPFSSSVHPPHSRRARKWSDRRRLHGLPQTGLIQDVCSSKPFDLKRREFPVSNLHHLHHVPTCPTLPVPCGVSAELERDANYILSYKNALDKKSHDI